MARLRMTMPRPTHLWWGVCALLGLGVLSTLPDLLATPAWEERAANRMNQRMVIDARTGTVGGLFQAATLAPAFEVAAPVPSPSPTTKPPADGGTPTDLPAPSNNGAIDPTTPTEARVPSPPPPPDPLAALPALRTEAQPFAIPHAATSKESIVVPPAPEVTKILDGMSLPVLTKEGARPSTVYSKRMERLPGKPYVAVLLTDVGFNGEVLAAVMALPRTVTVALSPYAIEGGEQITRLHQAGFETWGMLPTTTSHYPQDDPGPLGLIHSLDARTFMQHLHGVLSATLGATGMVLPPDETLSDAPEIFTQLVKEITGRGLFLLLTHPTRGVNQLVPDKAIQEDVRRADWTLDRSMTESAVASKLAGVKEAALAGKGLILAVEARPALVAQLGAWMATKPLGEEVIFAPLSLFYRAEETPPVIEEAKGGHGAKKETKKHGGH